MDALIPWPRFTELDRTNWPDFVDRIGLVEESPPAIEPRRYPGYPHWQLPRARRRWWPSLDLVLNRRRCRRELGTSLPGENVLGQLLRTAHGIAGDLSRGPVPSAGGLQALELFLVHWQTGWLPAGVYHYDRRGHHLAQVVSGADRTAWTERVPSLGQVSGGALLWLLVGDARRTSVKYGERGERFLLLEAGHLMQNLCLVSASLGLTTVPLGGCFEAEIARELRLLPTDRILYAGLCGQGCVGHESG